MLKMSTLYERLIEICRDSGIDAPRGRDIQAITGLSSGRVTQIKQERDAARLGSDALQSLLRKGYCADWIQEGKPPKRAGELIAQSPATGYKTQSPETIAAVQGGHEGGTLLTGLSAAPDRTDRVPVISWVQAGDWSLAADLLHPGEGFEWIETSAPVRSHTFALRVEGDSMEPEFVAGTILVVEPEMDANPGDYVIARNGDNEATFKQLIRDGADLYLKPLNPRYPIKPLGGSKIVGVVREAVKRYR